MTDKRFNDEEVSLILGRAMEGMPERSDAGLTLAQLKEIAAEVGVDPARIESAALTVQADRMSLGPQRKGARTSSRYEVEVSGEIHRDRYGDLLRIIRGAMGRQGIVTDEFGGMSWKARDFFGGRYLTVRSEDGHTRVEALGNFRDGALVSGSAGATGGLALTAVVLKALGGVAAVGVAAPLVLMAGATLPAWLLYRKGFQREDAALREAVAQIAARIHEESAAEQAPQDEVLLPPAADAGGSPSSEPGGEAG